MIAWFEIGFLPVRILDILDILIVGYLIYQLYRLLRGSIAFNIFTGVILVYVMSWLVGVLKMDLLSSLLGQFVSVGVLMLLIVFQPEVRRFLLILGNNTLRQRSNFIQRLLDRNGISGKEDFHEQPMREIIRAVMHMSRERTGALIVFASSSSASNFIGRSAVLLDAKISQPLIESIFNKDSPLHDGAMVIADGKIWAASCILPVSSNSELPKSAGLRHRAGVGATENSNSAVVIVSEETGQISYAINGKLTRNVEESTLRDFLKEHWKR